MSDLNFDGLTESQLRLFSVRCAERVKHLMTDPRSLAALDVAERHAKGEATDDELLALRNSASDAMHALYTCGSRRCTAAMWAAKAVARLLLSSGSSLAWGVASAALESVVVLRGDFGSSCESTRFKERAEQQKILEKIRRNKP